MSLDPDEAFYNSASMVSLSDVQRSQPDTPRHDEIVTADALTSNISFIKEEVDDESSAASSSDSDDGCSNDSEANSQDTLPEELPIDIIEEKPNIKIPDKWPTLEILPGGVIKPSADDGDRSGPINRVCMYACAKCPQTFKELFSLTKHLRTHNEEHRRKSGLDLCKLDKVERELLSLRRTRLEEEKAYRKRKIEVMARIGSAMVNVDKRVFL